jgi:hypothetical protein
VTEPSFLLQTVLEADFQLKLQTAANQAAVASAGTIH